MSTKILSPVQAMREALTFIEDNGLAHIEDWIISTGHKKILFTIYKSGITEEELRQIKRAFGRLEITEVHEGKNWTASCPMGEDIDYVIKVTIYNAYACSQATQQDVMNMSEEDWAKFRSDARKGVVKVQRCNAEDFKSVKLPEEEIEDIGPDSVSSDNSVPW